jgi:serine/threonine protein kinase/formylglycine-generating enzyme required for sulfatase activity
MPVKTWGDFEIQMDKVLGRGGMGAVYAGRQVSLDRPSAIKVLKKELTANPEFVKRFHREAALLARLVDSHVVQVFGAGEAEGEHFYAMEYVEGQDFAERLRGGYRFTSEEVVQVGLNVGLALQAAWKHRIVHRDIKPSNIIMTKEGEIKVMDFGLAKNPESDLTVSEVIMGTAKYMSPEQAQGGECDIRSDLYSLGVVLYELSAGQPPFTGTSATSLMYQHVHASPRKLRELNLAVPPELESVVTRLMAKDPAQRFSSPEALVSALRCIQDGVTPDEKSTLYNETVRLEPPGGPTGVEKTPVPPARSGGAGPLYLSLAGAAIVLGVVGYFVVTAVQTAPAPPADPPPKTSSVPPLPAPASSDAKPPPEDPKPLPAVPPPPPAWEEPRKKGLDAFGRKEWVAAWTSLEEARDKGATDVEEKIRQSHAYDLIAKGDGEKDDQKALEHYEGAKRYLGDDEDLRRKIARVTFNRWSKSAEAHEGADWAQAAVDWGRAQAAAEEALKSEVEAKRLFCDRWAKALQARTNADWEKALALFKELAREPRAYAGRLETEIRDAEREVAKAAELVVKKHREEFDLFVAQAKAALQRTDWKGAKEAFDRTLDPKYAGFSREDLKSILRELSSALAPPPGMIYVPGGRFRMGWGGQDVEGPESDRDVGPLFMDDHEATVAEYGAFLKELSSSGGHHPGCPKEEPPGKSHVPDNWEAQRPETSVTGVDWWDASSFAAWAKKRLPREAEWEHAASFEPAGGRRAYPWGEKFQKEAGKSFLGIDGLGSGVMEWTADWFQKYPGSDASHSDFGERYKVLRGGVLLEQDAERDARVTHRHWNLPSKRSVKIGIRCVKDVEPR